MKCYAARGENYDTAIFGDSHIVVTPHCHFVSDSNILGSPFFTRHFCNITSTKLQHRNDGIL